MEKQFHYRDVATGGITTINATGIIEADKLFDEIKGVPESHRKFPVSIGEDKSKQVCDLCGSTSITTQHDIGSDIDPDGEERQHMDKCDQCGAWRFHTERWHHFSEYRRHYGKWHERGEPLFPGCWEV